MTSRRKESLYLEITSEEVHDDGIMLNKLVNNASSSSATNLREIGIVIERPENKTSHSKDVVLIKQNVSDGETGNLPLQSFPSSSPLENAQIHAQIEHKTGNGELGDFPLSLEGKNENNIHAASTLEVPDSSPTSPSSRNDENHAQIPSDINGKPDGEVKGRASSCSPLLDKPPVVTERKTVTICSVAEFFFDDPILPYEPLPDHDSGQSPCYHIIAEKQGYYYCKLHLVAPSITETVPLPALTAYM